MCFQAALKTLGREDALLWPSLWKWSNICDPSNRLEIPLLSTQPQTRRQCLCPQQQLRADSAAVPCPSHPSHCTSAVLIQKGIHPWRHQTVEICHFWWVMESGGKNVILLSDLNLSSASSPCIWLCLPCWIKELFKEFLPSWRYFYPPWSKHVSVLFVVS